MRQYIINHSVNGFEDTNIDNPEILSKDANIILVLDESTNSDLYMYYNKVIDIIVSGANLFCISIGRESKIRKAIMMLMTTYKNYNIYKVDSKETVDEEYAKAIIERKPTLMEVQQFIGGDVSAYSELNTILTGIRSLVGLGDIEGIKTFVENHIESIDSSAEVFEYLRKMADNANSGEMVGIINNLKSQIDKSGKEISDLTAEVKQSRYENGKLTDKVSSLNRDLQAANRKVADLEDLANNNSSGSVITSYKELNTMMIKCKTQYILYFKELSYVKHMNSFIINTFEFLRKLYGERVKLMIYDNHVGIMSLYKGISVYNTSTYVPNKAKIIKTTAKMVISEPSQVFLDDVLTSMNPKFEIVMIYDRLKQPAKLVSGNNVTEYYVVNSYNNFTAAKESMRIPQNAMIISDDSRIQESVQIGEIPDYVGSTDSAKLNKYSKLMIPGTNERLMNSVLSKARISLNGGM